ncbi:MAG: hypothetical protein U0104_11260 [Gemmatimonadales bacterium]
MPFTVSVDAARRRVLAVRTGDGRLDEIYASIDAVIDHPDYQPGFDILFDLREAEYLAEGREALAVARFLAARRDRIPGRIALVPPAIHRLAIAARYLAVVDTHVGLEVQSFPTPAAALAWFDAPAGRAAPPNVTPPA